MGCNCKKECKELEFKHAALQFAVQDVPGAIVYYWELLEFEIDYIKGEPATYAVIFRDNVYIHLCETGKQPFDMGPGCGFISIAGIDAVWQRVKGSQVDVIQPLKESDYGSGVKFKDFIIRDPDKNVLRIGESIEI